MVVNAQSYHIIDFDSLNCTINRCQWWDDGVEKIRSIFSTLQSRDHIRIDRVFLFNKKEEQKKRLHFCIRRQLITIGYWWRRKTVWQTDVPKCKCLSFLWFMCWWKPHVRVSKNAREKQRERERVCVWERASERAQKAEHAEQQNKLVCWQPNATHIHWMLTVRFTIVITEQP